MSYLFRGSDKTARRLCIVVLGFFIISSHFLYQQIHAAPHLKICNLPARNKHFVSRPLLFKQIHHRLPHGPLVLVGGPGYGKTQIVKQYAHALSSYRDLVWWFRVDGTLSQQIEAFVEELNKIVSEDERLDPYLASPERLWEKALRVIRQKKLRGLFIFDNVEQVEALEPWLLSGAPVQVLLTSRNPLTDCSVVKVAVFSRAESMAFLRKTLPEATDQERTQLASFVGDHPLALALTASLMRFRPGLSVSNYQISKGHYLKKTSHVFADHYAQSLNATVELIQKNLFEKSPAAGSVLQFLALVNSTSIPLSFIERWTCGTGAGAGEALSPLIEVSLIEMQALHNEQNPTFSFHPLVRQIIRGQLPDSLKRALLEKAIFVISQEFQERPDVLSRHLLMAPHVFLHAKALSDTADGLDYHSLPLLSLRIRMLHYVMTGLKDFKQAQTLIACIDQDQAHLISTHLETWEPLSWIPPLRLSLEDQILHETDRGFFAFAFQMDHEKAVFYGSRALKLLEQKPNAHDEKLRVMSNMLQAYTHSGQLTQADALLKQIKPVFRTCHNPFWRVAFVLAHTALRVEQGRLEEALSLLQEQKEAVQALSSHASTQIAFLHWHAEVLARLGRHSEAAPVLETLHKAIVDFYGTREPSVLGTCLMLQAMQEIGMSGSLPKAITALQKARTIYAKSWGPQKHPSQGFVHFFLGKAYEKQELLEHALAAYSDAESVYDTVLKSKAVADVSALYSAFVHLALRLNKCPLAEVYFNKHTDVFGLNHPQTEALGRCFELNNHAPSSKKSAISMMR